MRLYAIIFIFLFSISLVSANVLIGGNPDNINSVIIKGEYSSSFAPGEDIILQAKRPDLSDPGDSIIFESQGYTPVERSRIYYSSGATETQGTGLTFNSTTGFVFQDSLFGLTLPTKTSIYSNKYLYFGDLQFGNSPYQIYYNTTNGLYFEPSFLADISDAPVRFGNPVIIEENLTAPNICYSDGTNCPASGGSMDYTNLALTNQSNIFVGDNAGGGSDFIATFLEPGVSKEASAVLTTNADRAIYVQGNGGAYVGGRDVTNDIEFIMGTSLVGVGFAGTMTDHNFSLRTENKVGMTIDTEQNTIIENNLTIKGKTIAYDYTDYSNSPTSATYNSFIIFSNKTAGLDSVVNKYKSGFLKTSGGAEFFMLLGQSAATSLFRGAVDGDNYSRFRIGADGLLEWGTGSSARDIRIQRTATNTLYIDDGTGKGTLIVRDAMKVGGYTAPTKDLEVDGDIMADNYYSGDGTQGMTGTCGSGTTLTVKDGLITACS